MSAISLYSITGVLLFSLGLYGLITLTPTIRKILALNVMGGGVFLVFIAFAYAGPDQSPDPVPHALVLTGIVVAVSTTAVALALVTRIHQHTTLAASDRRRQE